MAIVYLGVGSNLGDREDNIRRAYQLLEENKIRILKRSTVIETDPVGGPNQGKFFNAAIQIETTLSPHGLLVLLKSIEQKVGRVKTILDGPRTIDLDILLYDNIQLTTKELVIPHPRMSEREFVMKPLREITPEAYSGVSHTANPKNITLSN